MRSNGAAVDLAWGLERGSSDTVIAVLDSGLNMKHPDLLNLPPHGDHGTYEGTILLDGEVVELYHYSATYEFPYFIGCFAGTPVPWLPLAASQWKMVSMLQIASYTGAVGISFVVVAVNLGFAAYSHRLFREGAKGLGKRSQEFFLALFLVLVCFSVQLQETYGRVRFNVPFARVAFVQPYIAQDLKWDPAKGPGILKILEEQTLAAATSRPDVILWPEASTPLALRGDANAAAFASAFTLFALILRQLKRRCITTLLAYKVHDVLHLRRIYKRTLQAQQFATVRNQHVAPAYQLLCTTCIKNGAAVYLGRNFKCHTRREVCLDSTRNNIYRRP